MRHPSKAELAMLRRIAAVSLEEGLFVEIGAKCTHRLLGYIAYLEQSVTASEKFIGSLQSQLLLCKQSEARLREACKEGLQASISLDRLIAQHEPVETSERTEIIDRALEILHKSDCAMNNTPALQDEHCNCGAWDKALADTPARKEL